MSNLKILRLLTSCPLTTLQISKQLNWWEQFWIYIKLEQLETSQLITSYYDEKRLPERSGLRRRFYCLTAKGKQHLSGF